MTEQIEDDDALDREISRVIEECKRNGFGPQKPLYASVTGVAKGTIYSLTWNSGEKDGEYTSPKMPEREPGSSPITVTPCDSRGKSAVVLIGEDGVLAFQR